MGKKCKLCGGEGHILYEETVRCSFCGGDGYIVDHDRHLEETCWECNGEGRILELKRELCPDCNSEDSES